MGYGEDLEEFVRYLFVDSYEVEFLEDDEECHLQLDGHSTDKWYTLTDHTTLNTTQTLSSISDSSTTTSCNQSSHMCLNSVPNSEKQAMFFYTPTRFCTP